MGKIKDKIDRLSYKMKMILLVASTLTLLSATVSGCYTGFKYFASAKRVTTIEDRLDQNDLDRRIEFLERQYYNCKDRYGADFSKAIDPWDRASCRKWRKELDEKYKKNDNKYNK